MDPLATYTRVEELIDPSSPDDASLLDALASYARDVLPPERCAHLDACSEFPATEFREFALRGFAHQLVPESFGGSLDWSRAMRLCARLAAHELDVTLSLGGAILGSLPVLICGTDAHKAAYFGALLRGEMGGLGLSEWDHGSDLLAGETTAMPSDVNGGPATPEEASHFVLDGTKAPINNGTRAACLVVLARTGKIGDPFGSTLFFITRDTPGIVPRAAFSTVGFRSMDLSGVTFQATRIERAARMGELGQGFVHTRRVLEISRGAVATISVGAIATALSLARTHAKTRVLYGAPIERLGAVRAALARCFSRLVVGTALARRTSRSLALAAMPARSISCAAKLLCPILLEETVHECGTILGARSLMETLPFARLRRAAPVLAIFDGSSALQQDELWRHVARWAPAGALDSARARTLLDRLASPSPKPFDPHRDDDEIADASPSAMLFALNAAAPELGLEHVALAAERLRGFAANMRGKPQALQFAVSIASARIYALVALAEAISRAAPKARELLIPSLDVALAENASPLAAAFAELGAVDVGALLMIYASRATDARERAFETMAALLD